MVYRQRTLKNEIGCTGIGLHSGERVRMKMRPAPAGTGIRFRRNDLEGRPNVAVCRENVVDTTLATTVGSNGCTVSTIEHLMAAFFGLGIDNALIELDNREVPAMDGSAAPFVFLIKCAGVRYQRQPKRFIVVKKPFRVQDGNRSISVSPCSEIRISYRIDFDHPLLRNQEYELNFSGADFEKEISRARTFGFLKDVEVLKENGFARGGSLDNAVVIDDFKILNEDGLRFEDEFVRHKILDFIGDLSVIGCPVIGHFQVEKSGHFLNQCMLRDFIESKKNWSELCFKTSEDYEGNNSVRPPAFGMPEPIFA